jgi:hypothetical protein
MCDITEDILETLERFKDSTINSDSNNNNKIASLLAKPRNKRTKEEKEVLAIHVINRIGSVGDNNKRVRGEVAELIE